MNVLFKFHTNLFKTIYIELTGHEADLCPKPETTRNCQSGEESSVISITTGFLNMTKLPGEM